MKLKSLYIPLIIIIILFGGVTISKGLGIWITESTKIPKTISSGTYAGEYDPGDIRGSYTFNDIYNSFNITPEILAEAFNIITENPQDFQVKSLEDKYSDLEVEVGTDSVRRFTALYTGLPYDSDEILPQQAIDILYTNNKITDSETESLLENTIILPTITDDTSSDSNSASETENVINGKTTVKDVLKYDISLEQLEELIGIKINDQSSTIRDLCQENEISFSTIKNLLNELISE
ncbi:hypothetical protein [Vallitalea maricola]|uniref:Uncharacterized protein n=1 Tax=Vallitalea maricola TaxID=3074433 RepID=A0ACB5UMH6_9FIRM|nr:hypothetical protein AN2V17_29790 [Vallitalea sp. AN17-2]